MEIFKQLSKKGYKTYYEGTVEELDSMDKDNQHLHSEIMQVIMWLYENYGIWISVKGDDGKTFKYELHKWIWYESEKTLKQAYVTFGEGIFDINSEKFNSPTEAYESAIKYALEKCI